jgi:hypothetical protein
VTRRAWLAASIAAGIVSVVLAVSGGFAASVGGVRVSARSWRLSAAIAGAAGLVWLWSAARARAVPADLEALAAGLEARGRQLTTILAGLTIVAALVFSTYSASGADASGYLSQAAMWSHLAARLGDPLVNLPLWPLQPGDTVPLGWRPALERGWQVPTYAPGLPWLMAVPHAVAGTAGAVMVVIVSAGVAVAAVGALAGRLGGGTAALIASSLVATSPTFLYQAFQPMSDVPVTAAWTLCWLLVAKRAPAHAGLAAAVATLIRPNLAPLAAVPWLVAMSMGDRSGCRGRVMRFAVPVALAGSAIALLQWRWYGSPLTSGYGSAGELFALANVAPNADLYAAWLWEAERAFVLAAIVALACASWGYVGSRRRQVAVNRSDSDRAAAPRVVLGLLCFSAGIALAYFAYGVFEVWSYVRFLLPGMAAIAALIGAAVSHPLRRLGRCHGVAAIVMITVASSIGLQTARRLGVFQVAEVTSRAREAGEQLSRRQMPAAVLLAGEQSGSMRYATGRPVVRWEALDATSLRAALAALEAHGLDAWWVLDQFEESKVRTQFAGVPEAALDWPPEVETGRVMRTRAWRIASRPGVH